MAKWFVLSSFLLSTFVLGQGPLILITKKSSDKGIATVAGRVQSDTPGMIGVSVDNAGVRYSTIADPQGMWAITFRPTVLDFEVRAWMVDDPTLETVVSSKLDALPAGAAPWNKVVSTMGGGPTLENVQFFVQGQLRSRIEEQRRRCDKDGGWFEHTQWATNCHFMHHQFRCIAKATCWCRE